MSYTKQITFRLQKVNQTRLLTASFYVSLFYKILVRDENENLEDSLVIPAKEKHRASPFTSVGQGVLFSYMH